MNKNDKRNDMWKMVSEVKSFLLSVSNGSTPEKALTKEKEIISEANKAGFEIPELPKDLIERSIVLMDLEHQIKFQSSGVLLEDKSLVVRFSVPSENTKETINELLFYYDDEHNLKRALVRSACRDMTKASCEFSDEEAQKLEAHFSVKDIITNRISISITDNDTDELKMC